MVASGGKPPMNRVALRICIVPWRDPGGE
jgi:hypothetical protein